VTHRSDNGQIEKVMNKKIITLVSVAVIGAMFLLMAIQWATDRLMPNGNNLVSNTIEVMATLLLLPVRLYAFFVYSDHGSWPLPVLILLLAFTCLMWGVIVERIVWILSKRNTAV
jgi:hypothetical protein